MLASKLSAAARGLLRKYATPLARGTPSRSGNCFHLLAAARKIANGSPGAADKFRAALSLRAAHAVVVAHRRARCKPLSSALLRDGPKGQRPRKPRRS